MHRSILLAACGATLVVVLLAALCAAQDVPPDESSDDESFSVPVVTGAPWTGPTGSGSEGPEPTDEPDTTRTTWSPSRTAPRTTIVTTMQPTTTTTAAAPTVPATTRTPIPPPPTTSLTPAATPPPPPPSPPPPPTTTAAPMSTRTPMPIVSGTPMPVPTLPSTAAPASTAAASTAVPPPPGAPTSVDVYVLRSTGVSTFQRVLEALLGVNSSQYTVSAVAAGSNATHVELLVTFTAPNAAALAQQLLSLPAGERSRAGITGASATTEVAGTTAAPGDAQPARPVGAIVGGIVAAVVAVGVVAFVLHRRNVGQDNAPRATQSFEPGEVDYHMLQQAV
jgi:hypothetical protein